MRLLLLLLLMLQPATPNPCGPGACWWSSDECGRTIDPNSRHTAANGQTNCYRCLAGRYQPSSAPPAPPPGDMIALTPPSGSCIACEVGRYSSSTGSSSCIGCGRGQYSSSTGETSSSSCIACEAGRHYNGHGASSCVDCGVGWYSSSTGGTS
eukprot:COSAG02_NODE_28274_length_592_cov_1.243408_1_plen_152_part_10